MINCKDSFEIVLDNGLKIYTNFYEDKKATLTILNSSLSTIKITDTYSDVFELLSVLSAKKFNSDDIDLLFAYYQAYPDNIESFIKKAIYYEYLAELTDYTSLEEVANDYIDDEFLRIICNHGTQTSELVYNFIKSHENDLMKETISKLSQGIDGCKYILYNNKIYKCILSS